MNFWRISKRPSGIQGTRFPSFFLRQNSEKYLKSGKKIPQVQSEKYYTLLWKFGKYLWDVKKKRKSPHFIFCRKTWKNTQHSSNIIQQNSENTHRHHSLVRSFLLCVLCWLLSKRCLGELSVSLSFSWSGHHSDQMSQMSKVNQVGLFKSI